MDANIFWNNVKKRIKELNTTQEWVCNQSKIVLGTMRQQITHSRFPPVDEALLIAQALNTTVEYLVTGEDSTHGEKITEIKNLLLQINENLDKI